MIRRLTVALLWSTALALITGCASSSVKPWQKGQLATPPMQMEDGRCHRFERNLEVYREGAAGGNGRSAGGGCGCT